jgi:hypothetical protein
VTDPFDLTTAEATARALAALNRVFKPTDAQRLRALCEMQRDPRWPPSTLTWCYVHNEARPCLFERAAAALEAADGA